MRVFAIGGAAKKKGGLTTEPLAADALLVISSDGKGVVMHQQDLRAATRTASERTPRRKMDTR